MAGCGTALLGKTPDLMVETRLRTSVNRVRRTLTVEQFTRGADLAVKFAALIVAFGAVALVFFGPSIQLRTSHQTFLDLPSLKREYGDAGEKVVPSVVQRAVATYNAANEIDLATDSNLTGDRLKRRVCVEARELVLSVFPATDCDARIPAIGRNHYWERLVIHNAYLDGQKGLAVPDPTDLKSAIARMRRSQFVKVRAIVENTGHGRARNVAIRVPAGFLAPSGQAIVGPISLDPDDPPDVREYRTDPGIRESAVTSVVDGDAAGAPISRFAVDWERDESAQSGLMVWVAGAFALLWALIIINDSRLRANARTTSATGLSSNTSQEERS